MFYIFPLSLKVLLNLCLLSSKQETAYQNIEIKRKSSQSSSVFSLTSASLILQIYTLHCNLTDAVLNFVLKQLGQVRPLKADRVTSLDPTWNKLHQFSLSGSLKSWITKQYIQHLQY